MLKLQLLVFQSVIAAIGLRYAVFAAEVSLGRTLALICAGLHIPGMVVFVAGMRAEYLKIILPTFDFCFLQATNTLWAITLSIVLRDVRVVLVVACWANFTNNLFQETNLRNTVFMITFALFEWLFNALLMVWLAVGLVDDVHHYTLVTARGRTLDEGYTGERNGYYVHGGVAISLPTVPARQTPEEEARHSNAGSRLQVQDRVECS